jgi:microcin C transport system substrate-binding protein
MKSLLVSLGILSMAVALAGCGKKGNATVDSAPPTAEDPASAGPESATAAVADFPGMEADLARTVKEQPEFYVFKTADDFAKDTSGLTWDDGMQHPEFGDPEAKKGGTFTYYIPDFPRTLRHLGPDATGGIRSWLLDHVVIGCVMGHPNLPGEVFPGLATRWAIDRGSKTMYFELATDARWSDGPPVTTDDFVYHFYMMRSPHLNEPWYNNHYTTKYRRLTVYDKHHFALTMEEYKPDFALRAGGIAPNPRHFFQDFGPGWLEKYDWRVVPTTGAYTLYEKDIKKVSSVTLTRLKDWWAKDRKYLRQLWNPDRIRLTVIRDPDKQIEAFIRGDLDIYRLDAPKHWYERLPDDHPLVASGYVTKATFYNQIPRPDRGLWINSHHPLLKNRDIREGIHYASNWDLVCQSYFRGDAVVMDTRSDGYPFRAHPTIMHRPFDPVKARELFAKAGFTKQGPDGVLVNDQGQRLSFSVLGYLQDHRDFLSILKQEAIKAGIEYNLEILDFATGTKKLHEKQHEIAFAALQRSVELYPRYWELFHGSNAYEDAYLDANGQPVEKYSLGKPNPNPQKVRPNTNNSTQTFIPELDRLIEAYDAAETMDEIKSLAVQIEQIIHDDAAWVPGHAFPFFREGYWRWVRWPKDFNVREAREAYEFHLLWIDSELEAEVKAAQKEGRKLEPQVLVFDKYKNP